MKYNQPFGIVDPDAPYVNGNPETGTMGSIPPAASIEYPQREISNLILGSGITPSNADLNQLAKAIQSGQLYFGFDTGSANHMVTALIPTPLALRRGMYVVVYAADDNTGATDLTTNGVSTAVVRPDGSVLIPGDIKKYGMMFMIYDGTRWQLPSAGGASALKILAAPLDIYVNGSYGNDANDGISNTVGHALKTVQRAVDVAQTYNPSAYVVTIHVADGVYNEAVLTSDVATPTISIIGNLANPDAVVIGQSGACTYPKTVGIGVQGPNSMYVKGVCGRAGTFATDNTNAFAAWYGAVLTTENTSSLYSQGGTFEAFGGATININGNHKFGASNAPGAGGAFVGWITGNIYVTGQIPITLTIAPGCFWYATVYTRDCGVVLIQNPAMTTWAGSIPTGSRYNAMLNGVVNTQGGGASYIPGSSPGVLSLGGQYA